MRSPDNPIPIGERLFRSISKDDVRPCGSVAPSAVDLEGTSVAREKYCGDPNKLAPVGTDNTGLAVTVPGNLPAKVDNPSPDGKAFEAFAWDEPSEGDSHAEIRTGRYDEREQPPEVDRPNGRKPGGAIMKELMKSHIAGAMKVFKSP